MPDIKYAVVPDLGDNSSLPVVEIGVAVGDYIELNQGLITLESDKATLEIPATFSGRIHEILVKVDDLLSAGSPIATVVSDTSEPVALREAPSEAPITQEHDVTTSQKVVPAISEIQVSDLRSVTPYASPLVYRLAREQGVSLQQLTGTARLGRISRQDVMQFIASARHQPPQTLPFTEALAELDFSGLGDTERQPLSRAQQLTAARLSQNWATIPHVTHHDRADITELESLRAGWNQEHQASGVNVTLLAFLLKASATALKAFPRFNASLESARGELVLKKYCHIGFNLESPQGTVTPVVRDVDHKSVSQLAQEVAILSQKGHQGTLSAEEITGGCFTLSVLEGVGGLAFTPIINAPEVANLGISGAEWQSGSSSEKRLILPLSLSYDPRVIDTTSAARFVQYLGQSLADIRRLLL